MTNPLKPYCGRSRVWRQLRGSGSVEDFGTAPKLEHPWNNTELFKGVFQCLPEVKAIESAFMERAMGIEPTSEVRNWGRPIRQLGCTEMAGSVHCSPLQPIDRVHCRDPNCENSEGLQPSGRVMLQPRYGTELVEFGQWHHGAIRAPGTIISIICKPRKSPMAPK
jgi:hypothetical protein